jgi:peptide chain release factor 1
MLFEMYQKYAEKKGWKFIVLERKDNEYNGLRSATAQIIGENVYGVLKKENGVHRLVRISPFSAKKLRHTSFALVEVLPIIEEKEVPIKDEDLEISFFRSSGPGGQNVQKVETAVRIIHKPTGLIVSCQSERSQSQNKEKAMEILKNKLFDIENKKRLTDESLKRKSQIGTAERAEKIRTYNFPQDRITDHRVKKSWHNLEEILAGNLDEIIETLKKEFHPE